MAQPGFMAAISRFFMQVQRAMFWLLLRSCPTVRGTVISRESADGVSVAWIDTPGCRTDQIVFFLHGGGYCWGSISSHQSLASHLGAAAGCRVLAVDYRLTPEYPFPAALDDALAAYQWLIAAQPDASIAVAGDSAGGGLCVSLMLSLQESGARLPRAGLLLSSWLDLDGGAGLDQPGGKLSLPRRALRKSAEDYARGVDLRDPRVSPIYGDLAGLPPLLLHAGEKEVLVKDTDVFAERAMQQGVTVILEHYRGRMHVIHSFTHLSRQAREYLHKAGQFLASQLSSAGP